jgi:hypothetical protein
VRAYHCVTLASHATSARNPGSLALAAASFTFLLATLGMPTLSLPADSVPAKLLFVVIADSLARLGTGVGDNFR